MSSFWIDRWLPFVFDAHKAIDLPRGVELLNPYEDRHVREVTRAFYEKYYGDDEPRKLLFGINPGRFGAGITGINFTDPVQLAEKCGIPNEFDKRTELSSRFIYEWIDTAGGPKDFYSKYIILAIVPLGFVSAGKNMNFYDTPDLLKATDKVIQQQQQLLKEAPLHQGAVHILGKGKNLKVFKTLNDKHGWWPDPVGLPHPRWVMQYRYKTRHTWMDEMTLEISGEEV